MILGRMHRYSSIILEVTDRERNKNNTTKYIPIENKTKQTNCSIFFEFSHLSFTEDQLTANFGTPAFSAIIFFLIYFENNFRFLFLLSCVSNLCLLQLMILFFFSSSNSHDELFSLLEKCNYYPTCISLN